MSSPRVYLRLLRSSWRRWPLLEKLKLGGQYTALAWQSIAVVFAAATLGMAVTQKCGDSSRVSRDAAQASAIGSLALVADSEEITDEDRARFDELQTDEATVRHLRYLLREPDRLRAARALLEGLRKTASSPEHLHAIDGFITSTYYEVGEHVQGLEFLARVTRGLAENDLRYRWQFHAHIRELANVKGRAEAERIVEMFFRRTHRPELSRVWIGVPHRFMTALRKGATGHNALLEDSDAAYLLKLTRIRPDDPFIDHAYYVLREYDTVLAKHPQSLLRDAALRAAIYTAVTCSHNRNRCDLAAARSRLEELDADFPEFVPETMATASELLAKAGRLLDAEGFACRDRSCGTDDRMRMLSHALVSPHVTFGEIVAWLAPRDPALLAQEVSAAFEAADESLAAAERWDYARAAAILEDYERRLAAHDIEIPALLVDRLEEYGNLADRPRPRTAEEYFRHGLAEMGAARRTNSRKLGIVLRRNAVSTFDLAERADPASEWAPRSCYLRAAALRKLQAYEQAYEVTVHFLDRHHSSPLYDDMMAEKGWYLLRVVHDQEGAAKVFKDVARTFPRGNAADNALTLLAESLWDDCRLSEALSVYQQIANDYPASRLGLRAQQNARRLASAVRTRAVVPGLRGVQVRANSNNRPYVFSVTDDPRAKQNGLLFGDVIRTIGDTHIGSVAAYSAVMSAQQPGSTILLGVEADDGARRYLRVRIDLVERYDPRRVPDCGF